MRLIFLYIAIILLIIPTKAAALIKDPYEKGELFHNLRKYDLAIKEWENFIAQHPEDKRVSKAQYMIGLSYYQQNNFEQAIIEFQRITEGKYDPQIANEAQFMLGESHYTLHHYPKVIMSLLKLVDAPDYSRLNEVKYLIGRSYEEEYLFEQAITWYQKMIKEHPETKFAQISRNRIEICSEKIKAGVTKPEEVKPAPKEKEEVSEEEEEEFEEEEEISEEEPKRGDKYKW